MAANNRRMSGKKGAQVGSGGKRRRALEGKGPTPPAEMRKGHAKQRIAQAQARRAQGRPQQRRGGPKGTSEMVVGRNPVFEALRDGVPATTLYVQQFIDNDERVRDALRLAGERGNIHLMEAPRPELDRMTNGLNHQGLVLQVPPYEYAHPEDLAAAAYDEGADPLIVALDGVTDPRNLGAVVRSVAAFGGHGVVVPERRAAGMTAGAWKTSAGTAARTPVARATNLTRALEAYQKAGIVVVGLAADGDREIGDLEALEGPVVIVIGSEGKGLSRLVGETCDFRVRIPMPGGAESLNAGVAAGVVLYEAARRRG
ncbi:23S rRNA (guanosine(2251)-2'-O)-methyltransferase RlmB [Streptomyces spectabilis]|uniref:23S rRNA (Guanosine(2251)-2'-O)-methyltransferase RlmB n=1 Tax=Streptomyces spectabilis TaxID=68270 RepID=A0A5P2XCH5_STRST|nr:23S rRNA (guanosine(2251)-2'-O)-methyltransferase RlmB [Streptomyces spectabilis]MBB5106611.1 23S rRNA (guanosine2251-2'-O)-methyltransferase [Streptomyces spectabilis]MCI3903532.1 23S rRNA (guanosine(2251)-2'-O)-methyltransferase RlmB [Streptomyces spectabilis]QEV60730.1 23S rRNA (guanosine(2251)-2'-O)-methyltransferase RlmB [Streptomyces spectabilis]GGV48316.1 23S rRNA (guanosine(2251)-2'-O)-methyltransferase RlmB [Streptomyces spectabilis]